MKGFGVTCCAALLSCGAWEMTVGAHDPHLIHSPAGVCEVGPRSNREPGLASQARGQYLSLTQKICLRVLGFLLSVLLTCCMMLSR